MQVEINIKFEQLLQIIRALPSEQLKRLKTVIDKTSVDVTNTDLEQLLLNGPTANSEQLDVIANSRKAINQWHKM